MATGSLATTAPLNFPAASNSRAWIIWPASRVQLLPADMVAVLPDNPLVSLQEPLIPQSR
jgi:hypothetical protein